jgi:hypothetical protein
VLDRITPSVDQLIVHVDRVTHTPVPSGLDPGSATVLVSHPPTGLALASPGHWPGTTRSTSPIPGGGQ